MVTVVIATGIMNAGGAETLIMEMLRHRTESIRYVMLVHHNGIVSSGVYDDEIKNLGIPIIYIPAVGVLGEKRYIEVFGEKIKLIGKVDILHSHLNAVGGIIAKAGRSAGINNRIIHCHADITYRGNKYSILFNELKLKILKKYVKSYGTAFWACSDAAGKRLFDNITVKVIPNVIDVNKYLPDDGKKKRAKENLGFRDSLIIGSVGRIAPIKNYELAIRVVAELRSRGEKVDFICFGRVVDEKYYEKLNNMASELNVSGFIHFMGNSATVSEDIAAFDVFIMPSISEGFGMAAIEAQAAGLPVLVSTGVPRIVDVGVGLVKFLDPSKSWADEVESSRKVQSPDKEVILKAFNTCGYNSPVMTQEIEAEYQKMAEA